jgi:hypothetical protein
MMKVRTLESGKVKAGGETETSRRKPRYGRDVKAGSEVPGKVGNVEQVP